MKRRRQILAASQLIKFIFIDMKQQSLLAQASPKKKYTLLTSQSRKLSGQKRLPNSGLRSRQVTTGSSALKNQGSLLVNERIVSEASQTKLLMETGKSLKWSGVKKINEPTQKIVERIRQNIRLLAFKMQELFGQEIQDEYLASLLQKQAERQDSAALRLKKARSLEDKGSLSNQKNKKGWTQYFNGRV